MSYFSKFICIFYCIFSQFYLHENDNYLFKESERLVIVEFLIAFKMVPLTLKCTKNFKLYINFYFHSIWIQCNKIYRVELIFLLNIKILYSYNFMSLNYSLGKWNSSIFCYQTNKLWHQHQSKSGSGKSRKRNEIVVVWISGHVSVSDWNDIYFPYCLSNWNWNSFA